MKAFLTCGLQGIQRSEPKISFSMPTNTERPSDTWAGMQGDEENKKTEMFFVVEYIISSNKYEDWKLVGLGGNESAELASFKYWDIFHSG